MSNLLFYFGISSLLSRNMANFILNTDIFSPIHSDGSLNDNSVFSFSSPLAIPDSFGTKPIKKDSKLDKTKTKENVPNFELTFTDIKDQREINAEKEGKFRDTYEQLKLSIDKLSCNTASDIPSPIINKSSAVISIDTNSRSSLTKSDISTKSIEQKQDILKKVPNPSQAKKHSEKCENERRKEKRQSKNSKSTSQTKELIKKTSNVSNEDKVQNEKRRSKQLQSKKSDKLETMPSISSAAPEIRSNLLSSTKAEQPEVNLLDTFNQLQKKHLLEVPSSVKDKGLPAEKSLAIDVSMEFDKIRGLIRDLHNRQNKEIVKLQDMVKEQNKATEYLMTVVELLVEANKTLVSTQK